jgi:poly-gamma-glutamate capsule biosynthesis protein CapA/YwtB (metallophosphatase superfamily)
MLGRGIDQILRAPCKPTLHEAYVTDARDYVTLAEERSGPIPRRARPDYPWGEALAILESAQLDARVINLETSITRADAYDPGKGIHYRMSPENAACLAAAKVEICALGNNHVLDWGELGLVDTLATLDRVQISHCGAGRDRDAAARPAIIELGERGRIAVFSVGCRDGGVPAWWAATAERPGVYLVERLDLEELLGLQGVIDRWRGPETRIVLSIHWGPNWGFDTPETHRRAAHWLIEEAGVDVVHGHSSHHVKGIEVYRGRLILYGCGDLLTDYEGIGGHESHRGELSLLYLVTLGADGSLAQLEMVPMRTCRFRLQRATSDETRWLARTLADCGKPLGSATAIDHDRLMLAW